MKNFALMARTLSAWSITLLIVFPLIWLVLTAFKTEQQAISVPPQLFFTPSMESFEEVNLRSDYLLYARNSVITSVISTLLGLAIAAPAAYSMAFFRTQKTRDILLYATILVAAISSVPYIVAARTVMRRSNSGPNSP